MTNEKEKDTAEAYPEFGQTPRYIPTGGGKVADLPQAVKTWIAGHTLLGDPKADNERDLAFFQMAPINFWKGQLAGRHGYLSVTQSIENHYDIIKQILQLTLSRRVCRS